MLRRSVPHTVLFLYALRVSAATSACALRDRVCVPPRVSACPGRSGDVGAIQPKAAGSSLVSKLACYLVHHAMKVAGLNRVGGCLVLPAATGMSVTLVLLTLKASKPDARCGCHPCAHPHTHTPPGPALLGVKPVFTFRVAETHFGVSEWGWGVV
jgi:hypothetical protein